MFIKPFGWYPLSPCSPTMFTEEFSYMQMVESLITKMNDMIAKINELEIDKFRAELDALTVKVENLVQNVKTLQTDNTSNKQKISECEDDIDELTPKVTKLENDITTKADTSSVTQLSGRVTTIEGVANKNKTDLASLTERVVALEANP